MVLRRFRRNYLLAKSGWQERANHPPNWHWFFHRMSLSVAFCAKAMSMENYPSDWEKRRRKVFNRDSYECQQCGVDLKVSHVQTHCHHIKPMAEGGSHSYDNLTTVCVDCHNKLHSDSSGPYAEPIDIYSCSYCGTGRVESSTVAGSYCSERCCSYDKAEKMMNHLNNDSGICSSCHKPYGDGDTCRNCGNHLPNQDTRDLDIDRMRLIAFVYRIFEFGEP